MLLKKIEALRKEPKAVRNRYAFSVALSITLLITVVWGVGLPARFSNSLAVSDEVKAEQEEFNDQLIQLRDLFTSGVSEIKTQAELVGSTVSSTTTTEIISSFASGTMPYASTTENSLATPSQSVATSTATTSISY